jgi:Leucine-rich repeat (LRR) protein
MLPDPHDDSEVDYEEEMANTPTPLERAMEDDSEGDMDTSQLPAVEEYKSQVAASRIRANQILARESHSPRSIYTESKKKKKELMLLGAFLMVVILSISIGVGVSRKKKASSAYSSAGAFNDGRNTPPPTNRPTHAYDSQITQVIDFVVQKGWSDGAEARMQSSPQFQAATWIADFDPLQLNVVDTLDFRQRYALAVFYYALDGPNWIYNDKLPWLTKDSVCNWRAPLPTETGAFVQTGSKCYGGKEVKEIFLPSWYLRGKLPREIALLTSLEVLTLWNNELTGSFPSTIQKLTSLKKIDFHGNSFTGSLPDWIGDLSQLTYLNVDGSHLTGRLPDLARLSLLETVNLGYNDIRDDVAKLAPLKGVKNLIVANNTFYGDLSSDLLFSWPLIETLDMSGNIIGGTLPGNLFYMEHLEIIDLSGNNIGGSLPTSVRPSSTTVFLALQQNKLSGDFGFLTTHLKGLAHIDFGNNNFAGSIPVDWSGMTKLRYLFLAYNDFVPGSIPQSLTSLSTIEDLSLQGTNRKGSIPTGFGTLSSLKLLDFSYNSLTGSIPTDIGGATNLEFLFLNRNLMDGTVPDGVSSLEQLRALLLDHNGFTSMASSICQNRYPQLVYFISDCSEINCPSTCCTECCVDTGTSSNATGTDTCNADPWLGTQDPLSEYEYRRGVYQFHDNGISFPANGSPATVAPAVAPTPRGPTMRPTRASSPVLRAVSLPQNDDHTPSTSPSSAPV